jgi:uncharacterized membrane protein
MHYENDFLEYRRRGRIEKRKYNSKKRKKKIFKAFITIFISIIIIFLNPTLVFTSDRMDKGKEQEKVKSVRAKVVRMVSMNTVQRFDADEKVQEKYENSNKSEITTQKIELLITSGVHKNEKIIVENNYDDSLPIGFLFKKGDDVLLSIEEDEQGVIIEGYIYEVVRDKYMLYLVLVFIIAVILIGGVKGIKSLITLAFTAVGVIKILPSLLLKGYNPIYASIFISVIIVIFTLFIVSGLNKKSISAIIGTMGGVLIAAIIAFIIGSMSRLTGFGSEEAQMLMYIPQKINFDYKGLLFAGIIMGALGAVMDVSMSISSAMNEISLAHPKISSSKLMKAGMSVGRDIMGTMSNTLILAYVGASLQLIILLMAWNTSFLEIINREVMASEIVRAMAGSIGLIFSIPITVLASSVLREK